MSDEVNHFTYLDAQSLAELYTFYVSVGDTDGMELVAEAFCFAVEFELEFKALE